MICVNRKQPISKAPHAKSSWGTAKGMSHLSSSASTAGQLEPRCTEPSPSSWWKEDSLRAFPVSGVWMDGKKTNQTQFEANPAGLFHSLNLLVRHALVTVLPCRVFSPRQKHKYELDWLARTGAVNMNCYTACLFWTVSAHIEGFHHVPSPTLTPATDHQRTILPAAHLFQIKRRWCWMCDGRNSCGWPDIMWWVILHHVEEPLQLCWASFNCGTKQQM